MAPASTHKAHFFNALTYGGAAVAAIRIAKALKEGGAEISFWHQANQSRSGLEAFPGGSLYYAKPHRWLYARHIRRFEKSRPALSRPVPFSPPWHFEKPRFYPDRYGDGILHLHWLGGDFFDLEAFFASVPNDHPIVWTLHDVNHLTGGCHYAGACRGFEKNCGNCPQLAKPAEHDISRKAMSLKLRALEGKNLHFVAPSHWMEAQIRASSIGRLAKSVRTIHYPIDLNAFSPLANREEIRRVLGIASPAPILAFGAFGANDPRKGLSLLVQALLQVKQAGIPFQLLVFGASPPKELMESGIPCQCVGAISHQPILNAIYSVADLYALPSLEDNSPQTGIEAIACGTPVVGFNSGGIADYVKPGISGWLAETGNTDELALRIKDALSDLPRLQAMRASARNLAMALFEPKQAAEKYLELYSDIRK